MHSWDRSVARSIGKHLGWIWGANGGSWYRSQYREYASSNRDMAIMGEFPTILCCIAPCGGTILCFICGGTILCRIVAFFAITIEPDRQELCMSSL
ncbi:unnamed protein product [Ranitomeya imitator]|uniref:Uncharacterized protein n=1 Tax=Ranitomeya imitator TaxID=111125 RepID=A0ABN9KX32_9NEOB|nr:unnamed protein product [Ranitomeya imitator]